MKIFFSILFIFVLFAGTACEQQDVVVSHQPMIATVEKVPWNTEYSDGLELRTPRYRIFTTATANQSLINYLPGFMEAAYQNYLELTQLPDKKIPELMPIYVMASRQEWTELTKSIFSGNGGVYTSIQAGGYCHKGICVLWDMGGTGTFAVSSHEGLHQLFSKRMRNHLPMWLEEGLCSCAEGYRIRGDTVAFDPSYNTSRFNNLRAAILQGYWIEISKLLPMDAGDVAGGFTEKAVGYYGQLWALSRFIREHDEYSKGLARLLADAEAGKFHLALNVPPHALTELQLRGKIYNQTISEPVFRKYICDDLDKFEAEFKTYARGLVRLR